MTKFNDLLPAVQQRAIDANRYINVDSIDWYESTIECWTEKLEAMGFTNVVINFTGFCSQGDGASFTSGEINIEKVLRHLRVFSKYRRYIPSDTMDYYIKVSRISSMYYHEKTVMVDDFIHYTNTENQTNKLYEIIELIRALVLEKSKEIYKDLNQDYDYLTDDAQVKETLLVNEYDFDSCTGEIVDASWDHE